MSAPSRHLTPANQKAPRQPRRPYPPIRSRHLTSPAPTSPPSSRGPDPARPGLNRAAHYTTTLHSQQPSWLGKQLPSTDSRSGKTIADQSCLLGKVQTGKPFPDRHIFPDRLFDGYRKHCRPTFGWPCYEPFPTDCLMINFPDRLFDGSTFPNRLSLGRAINLSRPTVGRCYLSPTNSSIAFCLAEQDILIPNRYLACAFPNNINQVAYLIAT